MVLGDEDGTAKITKYAGEVGLADIVIPSALDGIAVTTLGKKAFSIGQTTLCNKITIPASVTNIEENFMGLTYVNEIVVANGNLAYKIVGGALLTIDGKQLMLFKMMRILRNMRFQT